MNIFNFIILLIYFVNVYASSQNKTPKEIIAVVAGAADERYVHKNECIPKMKNDDNNDNNNLDPIEINIGDIGYSKIKGTIYDIIPELRKLNKEDAKDFFSKELFPIIKKLLKNNGIESYNNINEDTAKLIKSQINNYLKEKDIIRELLSSNNDLITPPSLFTDDYIKKLYLYPHIKNSDNKNKNQLLKKIIDFVNNDKSKFPDISRMKFQYKNKNDENTKPEDVIDPEDLEHIFDLCKGDKICKKYFENHNNSSLQFSIFKSTINNIDRYHLLLNDSKSNKIIHPITIKVSKDNKYLTNKKDYDIDYDFFPKEIYFYNPINLNKKELNSYVDEVYSLLSDTENNIINKSLDILNKVVKNLSKGDIPENVIDELDKQLIPVHLDIYNQLDDYFKDSTNEQKVRLTRKIIENIKDLFVEEKRKLRFSYHTVSTFNANDIKNKLEKIFKDEKNEYLIQNSSFDFNLIKRAISDNSNFTLKELEQLESMIKIYTKANTDESDNYYKELFNDLFEYYHLLIKEKITLNFKDEIGYDNLKEYLIKVLNHDYLNTDFMGNSFSFCSNDINKKNIESIHKYFGSKYYNIIDLDNGYLEDDSLEILIKSGSVLRDMNDYSKIFIPQVKDIDLGDYIKEYEIKGYQYIDRDKNDISVNKVNNNGVGKYLLGQDSDGNNVLEHIIDIITDDQKNTNLPSQLEELYNYLIKDNTIQNNDDNNNDDNNNNYDSNNNDNGKKRKIDDADDDDDNSDNGKKRKIGDNNNGDNDSSNNDNIRKRKIHDFKNKNHWIDDILQYSIVDIFNNAYGNYLNIKKIKSQLNTYDDPTENINIEELAEEIANNFVVQYNYFPDDVYIKKGINLKNDPDNFNYVNLKKNIIDYLKNQDYEKINKIKLLLDNAITQSFSTCIKANKIINYFKDINGLDADINHVAYIDGKLKTLEVIFTRDSGFKVCKRSGLVKRTKINKRNDFGNSCIRLPKLFNGKNINIKSLTIDTLKMLKNMNLNSNILPYTSDINGINNEKLLYKDANSIDEVWDKMVETFINNINFLNENQSKYIIINLNNIISDYITVIINSDYSTNDNEDFKIDEDKIDNLLSLPLKAMNAYEQKYGNIDIDNIDLNSFNDVDSQSKYNKNRFKKVLYKLSEMLGINPESIFESEDPKEAIKELSNKLKSLDNVDDIDDIFYELSNLKLLNDIELYENEETSENSELVHLLYNTLAEKQGLEIDDDILESENNLKFDENNNENSYDLSEFSTSKTGCKLYNKNSKSKRAGNGNDSLKKCASCPNLSTNDLHNKQEKNDISNKNENTKLTVKEDGTDDLINTLKRVRTITKNNDILPNDSIDDSDPETLYSNSADFEEAIDSIFDSLESTFFSEDGLSENFNSVASRAFTALGRIAAYIEDEEARLLNNDGNDLQENDNTEENDNSEEKQNRIMLYKLRYLALKRKLVNSITNDNDLKNSFESLPDIPLETNYNLNSKKNIINNEVDILGSIKTMISGRNLMLVTQDNKFTNEIDLYSIAENSESYADAINKLADIIESNYSFSLADPDELKKTLKILHTTIKGRTINPELYDKDVITAYNKLYSVMYNKALKLGIKANKPHNLDHIQTKGVDTDDSNPNSKLILPYSIPDDDIINLASEDDIPRIMKLKENTLLAKTISSVSNEDDSNFVNSEMKKMATTIDTTVESVNNSNKDKIRQSKLSILIHLFSTYKRIEAKMNENSMPNPNKIKDESNVYDTESKAFKYVQAAAYLKMAKAFKRVKSFKNDEKILDSPFGDGSEKISVEDLEKIVNSLEAKNTLDTPEAKEIVNTVDVTVKIMKFTYGVINYNPITGPIKLLFKLDLKNSLKALVNKIKCTNPLDRTPEEHALAKKLANNEISNTEFNDITGTESLQDIIFDTFSKTLKYIKDKTGNDSIDLDAIDEDDKTIDFKKVINNNGETSNPMGDVSNFIKTALSITDSVEIQNYISDNVEKLVSMIDESIDQSSANDINRGVEFAESLSNLIPDNHQNKENIQSKISDIKTKNKNNSKTGDKLSINIEANNPEIQNPGYEDDDPGYKGNDEGDGTRRKVKICTGSGKTRKCHYEYRN